MVDTNPNPNLDHNQNIIDTTITINNETTSSSHDTVVASVVDKFWKRSSVGIAKYGTSLDRTDLGPLDWIRHAQEEHMDAILYLEKLYRVLSESSVSVPIPIKKDD